MTKRAELRYKFQIFGQIMSSSRNRSRILYFRVSEDEFERFKDLCQRLGARNMSDMVRSALLSMSRDQPSNGFERKVTERIRSLEESVARLSRTMEGR